ncbi:hypothetical protein FQA39_LY19281 [Lamprigera yunnana]|nr:hypothetical protein FQA39_LY19281 [Lamprigera yunnana]
MNSVVHISERDVEKLIQWGDTFDAVEIAMKGISEGFASQGVTSRTHFGEDRSKFMAILPGYIRHQKYGGLSCKIFTVVPSAEPTYIPLLDEKTGILKAIIYGNHITQYRTTAASLIASKYLHGLNSGLGRHHAEAFQLYFKFEQVRIWNRTLKRAQQLVAELNANLKKGSVVVADTIEGCLQNADVIVSATPCSEPLVKLQWVKKGAHINAIGVNPNAVELYPEVYKTSCVFVDSTSNAKIQLKHIEALGVEFKGQIGDLISKKIPKPDLGETTIFQSLGMGVEDCAVARMIYDLHVSNLECSDT